MGQVRPQGEDLTLEPKIVRTRVLIVDDDATHAGGIAAGLRLEGFEVETASDSKQGLALLAMGSFDLAVVDLMMRGINGIQLARLLRERQPQTRVVLTSAYHVSEPQLRHADCGAVGFVPKPIDPHQLASVLRGKLCGRSANASGAAA